jgi:hypothetical protein
MALNPSPQGNFNTPIPNSPFYWPETNTIQGGSGIFIVGAGLTINALGQITTTGGGGGSGTVTQVNTGVGLQGGPITASGTISLIPPVGSAIGGVKAGQGIAIAVDGTISSTRVSQVSTGVGLSGGPITSSGTISLNVATVSAIGGVKPDNSTIIIQPDGTISVGPGIADSVNSVRGTGAITVDNTDPANPIVGVNNASASQAGVVTLSNTITGTSQGVAATELAVSTLGNAALLKAGGTMTGNIGFAGTQTFPIATSTSLGVVQPDNTTITVNGSGQLTAIGGGGGSGTVTQVNTGTGLTGGPISTNGTISLLPSTSSVIGGVRPDGITTTVNPSGIISVIPGSAGGIQSVSGTAPITVNNTDPSAPVISVATATSTVKGVVTPGTNINIDSNGVISVNSATTLQPGVVQLTGDPTSTSATLAPNAAALNSVYTTAQGALARSGGTMTGNITFSSITRGVVFGDASSVLSVSDSTSTVSPTTAASSTAVKSAYDLASQANTTANAALPKAGGVMTGNISFAGTQTFPAAGSAGQVQLNIGGTISGDADLTYDTSTDSLLLKNIKGQGTTGVSIQNITQARTQSPYAVTDPGDLTTKSYVDNAIASDVPVIAGGTFFASSPSQALTPAQAQFWTITTWTNLIEPNTLTNLTYNPANGRFTNTSDQARTFAFTLQAAFTSTQRILDAYAFFQKNAVSFTPSEVYGNTQFGRGSTDTEGVLTTTWTFDLNPGEFVTSWVTVSSTGSVIFGNSTIGGLTNGNASTIIVTEVPGPQGNGNPGADYTTFLPQVNYNSGANNMINWPAPGSGVLPTLSYSNGVFTNNTNATRVYTVDFQTYVESPGLLTEAAAWVIVNNGANPAGTSQRRGQVSFLGQTGSGVAATWLSGSSTVTIQPGGTFGVAYYATVGVPQYTLGGAAGATFLTGQTTRLTVKEVTNTPPQYQGGVFQNTQTPVAYTANTNTLLTFPTEILDTNDALIPAIVNGVRVWRNSSTYARSFVFDYTAEITTSANISLAAIWLQKNSTSAVANGRFGMQTLSDLASARALVSNAAIVTLEPDEYVTAWFLCDQSGTIGNANFGNASGQGTRITVTAVSAIEEGFNQFAVPYGVVYTSNNTAQSVPGSTFATVPANTLFLTNTINASLLPLTNNQDGTWTVNQSGLYYIYATIDINALPSNSVATVFVQCNNVNLNSSIYVPSGFAPYSLNVSGAFYVQAGDEISLNYFNQLATTISNATISITTSLPG